MPTRSLRLSSPLDLRRTLAPVGRGGSDPSFRWAQGHCWRATRNVDGAATIRLRMAANRVEAEAWGPGAERALDSLPRLLGSEDRPGDFSPSHPLVARLHHRFPGIRIGRTDAVVEALVPSILEQKVTGLEARRAHRRIVLTYGRPAPGPPGLHLPPDPHVLARVPYYEMHVLGVERKRADSVRRACSHAHRVERLVDLPAEEARRRLMTLPGVGAWTAAEVTAVALGDSDAVPIGDYHIPSLVTWALAGERAGTDEQMLELLAHLPVTEAASSVCSGLLGSVHPGEDPDWLHATSPASDPSDSGFVLGQIESLLRLSICPRTRDWAVTKPRAAV